MRTFRITLILSILLIVDGFVCPPIGVIDSSVLTAVGMLLAFAILDQIPKWDTVSHFFFLPPTCTCSGTSVAVVLMTIEEPILP